LVLSVAALSLAACSSGGDDDDDDEFDPPDDADASGLWFGTVAQVGGPLPFAVIAAPNGEFVGLVLGPPTLARLMIGTGETTQNKLNATGTLLPPPGEMLPNAQPSAALTISAATVVDGASIAGNYLGGGENVPFNLTFDAKTRRGALLSRLAGTYSLFPAPTAPGATNITLSVNSTGSSTFATSTGCNGTGNFAVIDPALNMYSWTLTIAACGAQPEFSGSGLATLDDVTGGTNNALRMFGANNARTRGFSFNGNK
jgi:hypothetical protein